jgi:integrase
MSVAVSQSDARRLVKTSVPGVFRKGGRYVVVYRDSDGRQRKQSCSTLAEAKTFKATVTADKARGETVRPTRVTVADYFAEWLPAYRGRTRRGIREQTKQHYAEQMRLHVLPALGRRRLADVGPRDVKRLAAELRAKGLSENSVRLALAPLRAMLADAFEEETIRRNPAAGVSVAKPRADDEEGVTAKAKAKALTPEELARLLAEIPEQWRLLFELLAVTGLRVGELLGLQWAHVDFGRRRLLVRRRWYRGTFAPPKSKFGRRDVPLTEAMTRRLWQLRKDAHGVDDALVFPSAAGTPLGDANLYKVLKPAAVRAGLGEWVKTAKGRRAESWVGFHTFRHTCATALFLAGKNPKQVQHWLGHHAASFTMDVYVHLLPDDVGEAPETFDALGEAANSALGGGADHVREDVAANADKTIAKAL